MSDEIDAVDYGPLRHLIGAWQGDRGMDIAPEPDGDEHNPYHESLVFEPIGDVTNAESQVLAGLRYHQIVRRNSNNKVFHNETGYWMWDADQGLVTQTLTIPRGVCLVAGGSFASDGDGVRIQVHASRNDANWPIIESPFMRDNASTVTFHRVISVDGTRLHYEETTVVDIYGKRFDHTDENTLVPVGSD